MSLIGTVPKKHGKIATLRLASRKGRAYPASMTAPESINRHIVEGLYCEALVLSDEVRSAFLPAALAERADLSEEVALALSCEGLRTTTRMMQAVAWLLNHRAYLAGELSDFQLRRHGKLHPCPASDPARVAMLDPAFGDLIHATEQFHARLVRLDEGWRAEEPPAQSGIALLQRRLGLQAG